MHTSPSDKGSVVRNQTNSLEDKIQHAEQAEQNKQAEKNNTVMNSREFTGSADELQNEPEQRSALPSQSSEANENQYEPSHEKPSEEKSEQQYGEPSEEQHWGPGKEQHEDQTVPKDMQIEEQNKSLPAQPQHSLQTQQQYSPSAPSAQPAPSVQNASRVITPRDVRKWFNNHSWQDDPFIFSIKPSLLVGYVEQTNQVLRTIEEKHKLMLVVGPTGSGKTTLLKWACKHLPNNFITIFISKPPSSIDEFVEIFNQKFKIPWYKKPFSSHIKNIHQLPGFLQEKTKGKHLVVMCDEVHEAKPDVLEWLRVLTDSIDNMSLIVAGLPVFNDIVKQKLETFQKRIVSKIELLSLTKKETKEMIQKRIQDVGGMDTMPFTDKVLDYIYDQTGGFPREILRVSDELLNLAISLNVDTLTKEMIDAYLAPAAKALKPSIPKPTIKETDTETELESEIEDDMDYRPVSLNMLEDMTPLQTRILNMLAEKESTPGEIADTFDLGKYKSRQHAVRSVNNILIRLMQEDFVRRNRRGRTFTYLLSPRIKTLLVRR